jgi:hypothetical protein
MEIWVVRNQGVLTHYQSDGILKTNSGMCSDLASSFLMAIKQMCSIAFKNELLKISFKDSKVLFLDYDDRIMVIGRSTLDKTDEACLENMKLIVDELRELYGDSGVNFSGGYTRLLTVPPIVI